MNSNDQHATEPDGEGPAEASAGLPNPTDPAVPSEETLAVPPSFTVPKDRAQAAAQDDATIDDRPFPASGKLSKTAAEPNTGSPDQEATLLAPKGADDQQGLAAIGEGRVRQFGDHDLEEVIAQGGMGIVFRARQRQLNRPVALKMILGGQLATDEQVQRFYIEAEAAAQLDHPHIVPVYEVGSCQGQHFFSMAFVDGPSLADLVQDGPLTSRRAATLIERVADAVSYAHNRGIIHRDLKPGNVLLDEGDQPKVTDFGLAKISTADSQVTATGQVMGTPSYMPPEQATGHGDEVGPLADVYSLGAVLYCLLTGRPPFHSAHVLDTLKQVVEQEPVAPRQLNNAVDADIENITLKCLSKEPAQRYASAAALAADLQRYLNGEPVEARPVGTIERIRRWCRRNPSIAGLTAAVALTLVTGTVVSTYFAVTANQRAIEAERNLAQARKAVDGLYTRVSEHTLLNQPGLQPIRHELLREALAYYQWFLRERDDDPSVREELALNHFRVGLITEEIESPEAALPAYRRALELQRMLVASDPRSLEGHRRLADTLTAMGRAQFRQAELAKSVESYTEAMEIRSRIAAADVNNIEYSRLQANAHMNLGLVLKEQLDREGARLQFREAQQIRRDVLSRSDDFKTRRDLAMGLYNQGNLDFEHEDISVPLDYLREAVVVFDELLADEPRDLNLQYRAAVCHRLLADLQRFDSREDEAIASYEQAAGRMELLTLRNPDVVPFQLEFSRCCLNLHDSLAHHDTARALAAIDKSLGAYHWLHRHEPENADHCFEYAVALRSAGILRFEREELADARRDFEQSAALFQRLAEEFPDDDTLVAELAETQEWLRQLPAE